MEEEKTCVRCGKPISNGDVYHDMAVKYCDDCRADGYREKDAARHRKYRRRTKATYKLAEQRNKELEQTIRLQQEQNALLAQQNQILREQNERLMKE